MERLLKTIVVACGLIGAAPNAQTSLLHDNGEPDGRHGSEMTEWIEADDFILPAPARLEGVTFWQVALPHALVGSVAWRIYGDRGDGLGPGQLLFSGTATNPVQQPTGYFVFGGFREYITAVTLPPISLPRGGYWIALHNGPLSNDSGRDCFWEATSKRTWTASHSLQKPFTGLWRTNAFQDLPSDLAFQLTGGSASTLMSFQLAADVPELTFAAGTPGYTYRVEYKDHLRTLSWEELPGAEMWSGGENLTHVRDPGALSAGRPSRFYQVVLAYNGPGVPRIQAVDHSGRFPRISFTTASGHLYRVEYRDGLSDSGWKPVVGAETITGTGGVMHVNDPDVKKTEPRLRLYRVSLL